MYNVQYKKKTWKTPYYGFAALTVNKNQSDNIILGLRTKALSLVSFCTIQQPRCAYTVCVPHTLRFLMTDYYLWLNDTIEIFHKQLSGQRKSSVYMNMCTKEHELDFKCLWSGQSRGVVCCIHHAALKWRDYWQSLHQTSHHTKWMTTTHDTIFSAESVLLEMQPWGEWHFLFCISFAKHKLYVVIW